MNFVENSMYEIGLLLDGYLEKEMADSIGHRVFEITHLLYEYKNS